MNISTRRLKVTILGTLLLLGLMAGEKASAQECKVNLSNSNVDFGRVIQSGANSTLSVGNIHALGNRTISLNAICPQDSKMVLSLRGTQLGEQFKFAKQGSISVNLSNALLDGRRVDLAQVKTPGGVPGVVAASVVAVPGEIVMPMSGGVPAQGAVLSIQIEVRPLVPVAELRTRDATTLEADLSFEVRSY